MSKREIADSTMLDHNLNLAYIEYRELFGDWRNPSAEMVKTYGDIPTFAQFLHSFEENRVHP